MNLSIVIPAYNEADRIVVTLESSIAYLETVSYETELIVVSDGSTDDTCKVASGFPSSGKVSVRTIEYHPNRGKGYAVKTGMLAAQSDIVLFMDADYAVPLQEIEKGLDLLRQGFDIAIGSRAIEGARVEKHQNLPREIAAWVYTRIQQLYLGLPYPDTQCGFKLFRNHAAQALFARQRLNSVIFDPEILWLARRSGYRIAEFPVVWRHVENSRIQYDNIRKSIFVFQEMLRIPRVHRTDIR